MNLFQISSFLHCITYFCVYQPNLPVIYCSHLAFSGREKISSVSPNSSISPSRKNAVNNMTARNKFQTELDNLNLSLIKMGAAAEEAIENSVYALINQSRETAKAVIDSDKEISEMTGAIESSALKIILLQQPIAGDLRTISAALKIVTDIERIGKQAIDICSIVLHLCEEEYRTTLIVIPQMADLAKKMVKMCIDSFVKRDIKLAELVEKSDNEMDELFVKVKDNMIELIKEQSEYADQAVYLMMVAKYFEKIGDHAENIAQWVVFCRTGTHKNIRLI